LHFTKVACRGGLAGFLGWELGGMMRGKMHNQAANCRAKKLPRKTHEILPPGYVSGGRTREFIFQIIR
jgi:hypothetical protein